MMGTMYTRYRFHIEDPRSYTCRVSLWSCRICRADVLFEKSEQHSQAPMPGPGHRRAASQSDCSDRLQGSRAMVSPIYHHSSYF